MASLEEVPLLRSIVVEDEPPARSYLARSLAETGHVEVIAAVGSAEEAERALQSSEVLPIDVAFIDVRLRGDRDQSGVALAQRCSDAGVAIVFTTASPEFAAAAFELGACDYLLKPFSRMRLDACVARILARPGAGKRAPTPTSVARIAAKTRTGWAFLTEDDALAFEAEGRLTFVHTAGGRFDLEASLAQLDASYGGRFLRTHRNWLVNVSHVVALEREGSDLSLRVGDKLATAAHLTVPVSRDRQAAVRSVLFARTTGRRT